MTSTSETLPHDPPAPAHQLDRGILGTSDIVFMVLATSAPLGVVVALMPIALGFANGPGVPAAWLLVGVAMLLFAAGYVRQIPFVRNAGAFYAYISASFGRTLGLPAAYVAAISYFALAVSTLAALAFFCGDLFLQLTGLQTPWQFWALACIALVAALGYRRITLVASVLAVALVAEILMLLLLDAAILVQRGPSAFEIADFSVQNVFSPGLGIALIYAVNSMIGFEGTAIYQEEARNRAVTVPRATYVAVVVAGLLYFVTAWCLSTSVGSASVAAVAAADPGHFVTDRAEDFLGAWSAMTFSVLVITSAFAAVLGLFNNCARYLFALARDGVLPRSLSRTHPLYRSPHVAAVLVAALMVAVTLLSSLASLDPLLNISPMFIGAGSIGLMVLLAMTALGVPVFFARRGEFGWARTVAPALGGLGLAAATVLAIGNYVALTGVDDPLVNSLPWLLVVVAAIGVAQALWLRANRPAQYARIGASRIEEAQEGTA